MLANVTFLLITLATLYTNGHERMTVLAPSLGCGVSMLIAVAVAITSLSGTAQASPLPVYVYTVFALVYNKPYNIYCSSLVTTVVCCIK